MVEATVRSFRACMHACAVMNQYNIIACILSSALGMFFAVVPVIPVAISAGFIHEQYGTKE